MAGIIANVDGDIQKLRALKNEIENVKKSLKDIDVNVKIDIAEGLQEKLKSLTDTYNTLAEKVSKTEAVINRSSENILKTADAISKAQEKIMQAAKSMGSQEQPKDTSTSKNQGNSESIKQQASAYDDLKEQIDAVAGTRRQNVQRMIEEMNAIRLINAEINEMNKEVSDSSELSSRQRARIITLNNSLLEHKAALSEVRQSLSNMAKLDISASTSMNEMSQSLSRMRIVYRGLSEEERNSPFGKELLNSIQQADAKIKELDFTIGNSQRNVGNYKNGYNGLNMSVQQIVRELPSAKMGLGMFFLAISNNLPILTDEIKRVKVANDALKASGESTVPVWKQVLSSLFSWQTAMMVGITMLTIYGKDIQTWISGLLNVKKAIDSATFSSQQLHAASLEGQKDAVAEQVKLKALYGVTQDHSQSLKNRKLAVDELQKQYPAYFGNLTTEAILAGQASDKYKQLTDDILKAAKARAYEKRIESLETRNIDLQRAVNADTNWTNRNRSKVNEMRNAATANSTNQVLSYALTNGDFAREYNKRTNSIKDNTKEINRNKSAQDALAKQAEKMTPAELMTTVKPKTIKDRSAELARAQDRYNEALRKQFNDEAELSASLERKTQDMTIDAMNEGYKKRRAALANNRDKDLYEITKNQESALNKKIEDARDVFNTNPKNKGKVFSPSGISLSPEEVNQYNAQMKLAYDKYFVQLKEELKKEKGEALNAEKVWIDYYKQFGDYAQKRLALESELQVKIKEIDNDSTTSDYQKNGLKQKAQKETQDALDELDKATRNSASLMGQIFQDTATMGAKEIDSIIGKVELLISYLSAVKDASGNAKIGGKAVSRNDILNEGITSNTLTNLQNNPAEVQSLREQINKLREALKSKSVTKAIESDIKTAFKAGDNDKSLSFIGSLTLKMQALVAVFDNYSSKMKDFGNNIGTIIGDKKIGSTFSAVTESISGLGTTAVGVGQIMSGDFIGGAMSAASGISKVVSSLNGLFGADYSEYNEMVDRYKSLISTWDELIERKKKYLSESYGSEVTKTEDEINQLYEKEIAAYKQLAKERLSSGSSTGSHAIGVRYAKNMNSDDWSGLADALGMSVSSVQSLLRAGGDMKGLTNLTTEQLKAMQGTTAWEKLDSDVKTYFEDIIKASEAQEDALNSAKENALGISFDSVLSEAENFLDNLSSDIDTYSQEWGKMIQKQLINSLIVSKYEDKIKTLYDSWYKSYSDAVKTGDTNAVKNAASSFKAQMDAISQEMLTDRNNLSDSLGWSNYDSVSASTGTSITASQSSVDESNGRLTAVEEVLVETKSLTGMSTADLKLISGYSEKNYQNVLEIHDLIGNSYSELQGIHSDTKELTGMIPLLKNVSTKMDEWNQKIKTL